MILPDGLVVKKIFVTFGNIFLMSVKPLSVCYYTYTVHVQVSGTMYIRL